MSDVFEAGALIVRGGLLFRVRASGDLAAVVLKASGHVIEIPLNAGVNTAAAALAALVAKSVKAGFKHLSPAEHAAHLEAQARADAVREAAQAEIAVAKAAAQEAKDAGEAALRVLSESRAAAKAVA